MTQRRIYQHEYPYFVTFRTREGFGLFEDENIAGLLTEIIIKTCRMKRYNVLAFQIMPDHVHILIHQLGTAPAAGCGGKKIYIHRAQPAVVARPSITTPVRRNGFTISELMHGIKSYFAHQLYEECGINYSVQQLRFYTRIVNTRKYLGTVIQYIQHNPVKAELPEKYKKFPYQYFNWKLLRGL